jgi:hypothetical protein
MKECSERVRYSVKLETRTGLPSVIPELVRQMRLLGTSHGFEYPHEVRCKVSMVVTGVVTHDEVHRLLNAVDDQMMGVDARAWEGDETQGD